FITIGERATDQQRRQQARALNREDEADLAGAGDRERLPAERGQEGRIADQRDRLAREQQPKIAVPQRLKGPRTVRGLRNPFHASTLVVRSATFAGNATGFPATSRSDAPPRSS